MVMFSRASVVKAPCQLCSSEHMAPRTVSRTCSSRNLCRLEICGRRSEQKLRDKWGRVARGPQPEQRWRGGEEAGGEGPGGKLLAVAPTTT